MKIRKRSSSSIQYILVANGSPQVSPFLPPGAFQNLVVNFIGCCPQDIMQLVEPVNFLEVSTRNLWAPSYDLEVFNIEDAKSLKEHLKASPQIQLVFIDGASKEQRDLFIELRRDENKSNTRFFHFYNSDDNVADEPSVVLTPNIFFNKLVENDVHILHQLGITELKIHPSISIKYEEFNKFNEFVPTRPNYYLLNRIIGNFGTADTSAQLAEVISQTAVVSRAAILRKNFFDRQSFFIKQIQEIDFFFSILRLEELIKLPNPTDFILPPLVLVFPFHNPDVKGMFQNQEFAKLFLIEQTANYTVAVETKYDQELVRSAMQLQRERLSYLDQVSSLHSSFSFSPVVRMPLKGRSIYTKLSFFRPKMFPNLAYAKSRRKLKKTIYKFGASLKSQTIGAELEKEIRDRNGQIVAISDLPIEWTLIDGVPLSFTHDVCRLPETSLHGLMSFYASNLVVEYSIPSNVLEKTLVICGAHNKEFKIWHPFVLELGLEKGFAVRMCSTNDEVKNAIEELRPDFIIFDCHGGYDEHTKSTYLNIGSEILDGKYIVENNLSAPLIFLSACGTAPTYGTINPIANAFFEAGAISVTSTYLPISVDGGSLLYFRVLNNLAYAAQHTIHRNWLEFVCHVIRTSSIHNAYLTARKNKSEAKLTELTASNIVDTTELLDFRRRRKLFHSMDDRLSALTGDEKLHFSEVIPEYLLYSNLGRSDLITFDSWTEKYLEINN